MSQALQTQTGLKIRELCSRLALPASTLRRWRQRQSDGLPLLQSPGPKKLQPLPVQQLHEKMTLLKHGLHRTQQTALLYEEFADSISRRDLAGLVANTRQQVNAQRRATFCSVQWLQINVAWAIDATEIKGPNGKLNLIVSRELASRFFLPPVVSCQPHGTFVAQHLRQLFHQQPAPLFLKRDNGSIFNASPVNQVLAEFGVIPLNSPAYYAPYNGSIENGIRELKTHCLHLLPEPLRNSRDFVASTAQAIAHQRNCLPRRCLDGCSAAQKFYAAAPRFTRRQRQEIFHWIYDRWSAIISGMERVNRCSADAAWRHVVVCWLRCQRLIDLNHNPKLLPYFAPFCAQN